MEQRASAAPGSAVGAARPAAATALLAGVVDYAGLFPPAALEMPAAVAEYAAARANGDAWMLGRFVLPAARLGEFADARPRGAVATDAWALSAIVRDRTAADRQAVDTFNAWSHDLGAAVDTVEGKPVSLDGIDWLAETYRGRADLFVEVPGDESARWLERAKACGVKAKVRTGGLTADAFPSPAALIAFIDAALRLGVPFKATAGLHHAVRGSYPLTYAADAASAPMYGYLNVLLATAARAAGMPLEAAASLLEASDAAELRFTDQAVEWGGRAVPIAALAAVRSQHLVSFGSCSFREPVDELQPLTTR